MTATPYATADDVAAELHVTFTSEQEARAEWLIVAMQAFVDDYCGCTFGATDTITGERHRLYGDTVYLRVVPIASVQAVRLRSRYVGAQSQTITANDQYELIDLVMGELRLGWGWDSRDELLVDYTPNQSVPEDLTDVVAQTVAARMSGEVSGGTDLPPGVKRYEVGNELQVEMFSPSDLTDQAVTVLNTLKLKRPVLVV